MIGDGLSFSFWQIPTSNIMKIASVVAILLSSSMIFLVVNGGGDLDRFLGAGGRHDASAPPAGDGGDNDERINEGFLPLGGAIRSGSGRTARARNGTPAMNFPSSVIGGRIENDFDNFSGSPVEEEAATVPLMTQSQQRGLLSARTIHLQQIAPGRWHATLPKRAACYQITTYSLQQVPITYRVVPTRWISSELLDLQCLIPIHIRALVEVPGAGRYALELRGKSTVRVLPTARSLGHVAAMTIWSMYNSM